MDEKLRAAVDLFNDGRFSDFQDAMEALTSTTRAASERQFYTLLNKLSEALLQLSDGGRIVAMFFKPLPGRRRRPEGLFLIEAIGRCCMLSEEQFQLVQGRAEGGA